MACDYIAARTPTFYCAQCLAPQWSARAKANPLIGQRFRLQVPYPEGFCCAIAPFCTGVLRVPVVGSAPGPLLSAGSARGRWMGEIDPFWVLSDHAVAGYRNMDFVRVRLPHNIITWIVAVIAIHWFSPF